MKKRFVGLFTAFVMLVLCIPICTHAEIIASGNERGEGCTENDELHWTLDSDGLLTISGTGGFWSSSIFSDYKDKIKSLVIEDGITDLPSFCNCKSLSSISIPDSVTGIEEYTFYDTAYYDDENNWENGVLYIDKHLIKAKPEITELNIKTGTITIADEAFSGCENLESITMPESLKTIPPRIFDETAYYRNDDNWENGLLYNGNYLITAKNDITSANIKEGTTVAASCALGWCENLESVTLPDSLTTMGERMFICCSALKSIDIPDTVTSIGGSAFGMCSSLETVVIPTGVTHIADGLLSYSGITSIDIPDTVTSMGDGVFDTCEKLKSVKIGCSLSEVGNFAFNLCTALETIDVSPNNPIYKSVDNVLFSKDGTEILLYPSLKEGAEYTVPDGVTKIDDCAFRVCPNLQKVIIPEGVVSIGADAFDSSGITEINIPDSVTDIGYSAFLECGNLNSISIGSGITKIYGYTFYGCNSLTDVSYRGTEEAWNRIDIEENGNEPFMNANKTFVTAAPTTAPTATPTASPAASPTVPPTPSPAVSPTATPATAPTTSPTATPAATPTSEPSASPTASPAVSPTAAPKPDFEVSNSRLIYNGAKTDTVLLIFAKYSGTSLETVKFASFDLTNKETSIAAYSDYDKMFIWDGVNSMRPVTEHKKLKIPKN